MKLIAAVALATISLNGCAVYRQRMDLEDLRNFQIDCANKDAQIRFLESQKTTSNERVFAVITTSGAMEFASHLKGETTENRKIRTREYDAAVDIKLWDLRTHCR